MITTALFRGGAINLKNLAVTTKTKQIPFMFYALVMSSLGRGQRENCVFKFDIKIFAK